MHHSTFWWLLAGLAAIAELLTGTLYLLMLAIGLAAAAVAAHLGAGQTTQVAVAALVAAITVLACYLRQKRRGSLIASQDTDMQLDVGERVAIDTWATDGTAQVRYRGAPWTARLASPAAAALPGIYRVVRLDGNQLLVEPA